MSELHMHIISFDIPYPANYGGVIDVYYKAKQLAEHGVQVHLHCFQYGRDNYPILKDKFYEVKYYRRDISKKHLFKSIPYIVSTRISEELIQNLLKDNYPILMEGLHTSFLLEDPRLKNRRKLVRAHNIEHDYYQNLGKVERDVFKKYYFFNEAAKLKRYEKVLDKADRILAISENDKKYFSEEFSRVEHIPAFHPFNDVNIKTGKGDYVLYHGNLSVAENENAVNYIIDKVFTDITIPLKIAGLNPPKQLRNKIAQHPNIELIINPSDNELLELIRDAHINISITAQRTGLKLKLLNSLFNGRFALVNEKMLSGSNLDELCVVANNHISLNRRIKILSKKKFTTEHIEERKEGLHKLYCNGKNARKLIEMIS
jgi:glycosyltransferase involved in cell wall biosynthesis